MEFHPGPVGRLRLFAEAMRERRTALGETQREIAARAGVSESTWSHLERLAGSDVDPHSGVSAKTVRAIARAIGLPVLEALELVGIEPAEADLLDEAIADMSRLEDLTGDLAQAMERLRQVVARARAMETSRDQGSDLEG